MAREFSAQQVAGYVFNGVDKLIRAKVNRGNLVLNSETGAIVDVLPSMAMWYTRRNVQNALAKMASNLKIQQGPVGVIQIVEVPITPELVTHIGAPRLTRDHALHLMTAGRERILERKFTDIEVRDFEKAADLIVSGLDESYTKAAKLKSA